MLASQGLCCINIVTSLIHLYAQQT